MDDTAINCAIYQVGSGNAFYFGVAGILLGLAISPFLPKKRLGLLRNLAVSIGGIFVAISATPLPWWFYAALTAITLVWLPLEWRKSFIPKKSIFAARMGMLLLWLTALGMELPYHFMPVLPALGNPVSFVIGDSISAGTSDGDKGTWPKLLAREHFIDVRDLSAMGATVRSARTASALTRVWSYLKSAATTCSAPPRPRNTATNLIFCSSRCAPRTVWW
jgi:hypothetical protein